MQNMFVKKHPSPAEEDVIPPMDNNQEAAVSDPTYSLEADDELLCNEINYLSDLSSDIEELESEMETGTEDMSDASGRLASGLETKEAQVQVQKFSSTKYKSHRRVPESVAQHFD